MNTTVFMLFCVHKFLMYCQYLLLYLLYCDACKCLRPWHLCLASTN